MTTLSLPFRQARRSSTILPRALGISRAKLSACFEVLGLAAMMSALMALAVLA